MSDTDKRFQSFFN